MMLFFVLYSNNALFLNEAEFVITVFQQAISVHKIKLFLTYASMPSMLTEAAFSRVDLSATISIGSFKAL